MKKCFTINQLRKKEEILSYLPLLENNIYQAVEIFYPYKEPIDHFVDYTNSINTLISKVPSLEVVLHLPHALYNGLCLDEHLESGSLQIMMAAAKYASSFNVKKLTLHLGHINKDIERSIYINKIIPILQVLCDYVNNFDQVIMIENMPSDVELGYSPQELLTIFERVNRHNIKFIFDTGHAHASIHDDTSYLVILKDYLYHIHYNDNNGLRDEHKRIGLGTIDFDKHFAILKEIGYEQLHCMEVIYKDKNDLEDYANDLMKYEDML